MDLLEALTEAAEGRFPADDGTVVVSPSPIGPCDAVIAFTAHCFVAAEVSRDWVDKRLPTDDFTGPMRADFIAALAAELGVTPGSLDVLLVARGTRATSSPDLVEIEEGDSRTKRAHLYRTGVRSFTDAVGHGVVNVGRGVAGRWDLSIELDASRRSLRHGRGLIAASRSLIPEDDHLFASVAPGNARCLRACLAAGFAPIGAEVLFLTRPPSVLEALEDEDPTDS